MSTIEEWYPSVKKWELETSVQSLGFYKLYEALGYVNVGEGKGKDGISNVALLSMKRQ